MDDLTAPGALRAGEYAIADKLPNPGSPRANYYQNMSVLREEMRRGVPIGDASGGRQGLSHDLSNAARNALKSFAMAIFRY